MGTPQILKFMRLAVLALLAGANGVFAGELPTLPNSEPVLRVNEIARQAPVLVIERATKDGKSFEVPFFRIGNKEVWVRRSGEQRSESFSNGISIFINGKPVANLLWWGDTPDHRFGYPYADLPDDPSSLLVDEAAQTIRFDKPYIDAAGKRAVFTYTIRSLKDSRLEISWNAGGLWVGLDNYRGKRHFFGETQFTETPADKLLQQKNGVQTPVSGDFTFNADEALGSFRIEMNGLTGQVTETRSIIEKYHIDRCNVILRTASPHAEGTVQKVVLDFGECAMKSADTPPAIAGIDFWKDDATHVPVLPTRNIMPNPSFEQDSRYWRFTIAGNHWYNPDSPLLKYEVVPEGYFGKHALLLRSVRNGARGLAAFPLAVVKDQAYTLSFYAKAKTERRQMSVSIRGAGGGAHYPGQAYCFGDLRNPESQFKLTGEWLRYSRSFKGDPAGLEILLTGEDVLIDGIQLEEGDKPTDFISAPLEGNLTTGAPWNDLSAGQPIHAVFTFTGKPDTIGEATISVKNVFREIIFSEKVQVKIGADGTLAHPLALDPLKVGEGVFVVRADYLVAGVSAYCDYYRFSVMKNLSNTHATKDIFGAGASFNTLDRGDELARKWMEWGFGATTWYNPIKDGNAFNERAAKALELYRKYRIQNYITACSGAITTTFRLPDPRDWKEVTPEYEKVIEEMAYQYVKAFPQDQLPFTAFSNEDESNFLPASGNYDEYFKAQRAVAVGAKRANPKIGIAPTHGTSGYNKLRGKDAIEGYLKASQKAGFKYDAVGVHPYANSDYNPQADFDTEARSLIECMARYGYGKETPILFSEYGNETDANIPAWGTGCYDNYNAGKPTYDFGNAEINQGAHYARAYIMALKYWPQLKTVNIWVYYPFLDIRLTPLVLCKAVNTLGNLMGDVEFQADIRPSATVRGYAFKLKDGTAIAAIWTTDLDVENSLKPGPVVRAKFGQPVSFTDFVGNARSAPQNNGVTEIRLTAMPLYIKAADVSALAAALQNAECSDNSENIQVNLRPALNGDVVATVANRTGREQEGTLDIGGSALKYAVKPESEQTQVVTGFNQGNAFGKLYVCNKTVKIAPVLGDPVRRDWKMTYFYVPKVAGIPDWSTIAALPADNRLDEKKPNPSVSAEGQKVLYKLAWDEKNLYLHVEVQDDQFLTFPEVWENSGNAYKMLYVHDGALEVYFDTGADARLAKYPGYDNNDYRYDFCLNRSGKDGKGEVYRLREVYHQLADGVKMPTKQEAAEKVLCDFRRTPTGYEYTIVFAQRYIEPLALRAGTVAGFGLFLHDRDRRDGTVVYGGLCNSTELGAHCDYKPQFWPQLVLSDQTAQPTAK